MSDAVTASAAAIRAELDALRAAGARTYDAPAFDFAIALVSKAEAFEGEAARRLLTRAAARTRLLATELAHQRERACAAAARAGVPDADGALERALAEGQLHVVLRAARRHASRPSARARPHRPATERYDASRAEVAAMLTALHAEADLPAAAGPYNPLAIAAGALAELAALSPSYLAALVAQLTDLGALLALPPAPAQAHRAPASRRARRSR